MKNSWTKTFRRLAAGCIVAGCTAMSSAMCYAATAYDDASDSVYADGWQAGDNGGSGFTAWNFDSRYGNGAQYTSSGFKEIDDGLQGGTQFSNPHNAIGEAWTMGEVPTTNGAGRAGRGFDLAIGETLKVVFDNPTGTPFFKGYFIRLNGGTKGVNGNICSSRFNACSPGVNGGSGPLEKANLGRFEYFSYGEWGMNDAAATFTGVLDTDTAAAGAVFTVARTAANTYDVLLDSLGGGADFSATRTFLNPHKRRNQVDWIEFVFFNGVASDETPTLAEPGTELYIRSMEIFATPPLAAGALGGGSGVPEPGTAALLLLGATGTVLATARRRRNDES